MKTLREELRDYSDVQSARPWPDQKEAIALMWKLVARGLIEPVELPYCRITEAGRRFLAGDKQ